MQITITVPDTLPKERLQQRIQELEQSLLTEAKFFAVFVKQQAVADDPWTNPAIALPTVDTGIEDFALNHDHYLQAQAIGASENADLSLIYLLDTNTISEPLKALPLQQIV